jgi:AcrR family transcriptional regulator
MTQRRRRATRGAGEQLRDEIIVATKKLLAESGRADDVSIRAVAEAVGVTPPSIYLHFADKNDLLGAVVADVFREMDDAMITGAAEADDAPLARLFAFGMSYVRFSVSHPEHYRIAAMDPCPRPNIEVDEVLRSAAFEHFRATVVECIDAGIFAGDELPITLDLWAAAHGVAALLIAKPYLPWGSVEEFAGRVLCSAAAGHAVMTTLLDPMTPGSLAPWLGAQRKAARRRSSR